VAFEICTIKLTYRPRYDKSFVIRLDGGTVMKSISTRQLGAALGLLRWRVVDLAEASGVAPVTIFRKEPIDGPLMGEPETIAKIIGAFERAGIEFTYSAGTEGVRRRL
jgi:hypothetical protein